MLTDRELPDWAFCRPKVMVRPLRIEYWGAWYHVTCRRMRRGISSGMMTPAYFRVNYE